MIVTVALPFCIGSPYSPPSFSGAQLRNIVRCFASPRNDVNLFAGNQFFHLAQLLLAEEHLLADEEGRRAERAAVDGGLGVSDQLALHVGFLRARQEFRAVEAR